MRRIVAGSIDLKIGDSFTTSKSLDDFSEDIWLVENTQYDVVESSSSETGIDLNYYNIEYGTRGSLAWDAGEVNLEDINKQINTPGVICELNGESVRVVKDEKDVYLESHYMDHMNTILIPTGLYGEDDKRILDSLTGQLSDGLWENSPRMEKYWKYIDYQLDSNDQIMIQVPEDYRWWLDLDGPNAVKAWFAKHLKQLVKKIAEWNPTAGYDWKRDNDTQIEGYFHRSAPRVKDIYRVYDKLLNRKDRVDPDSILEGVEEEYYDVTDENGESLASFEKVDQAIRWAQAHKDDLKAYGIDRVDKHENRFHIASTDGEIEQYRPSDDEKKVDVFITWLLGNNALMDSFKRYFSYGYDDFTGDEINKPSFSQCMDWFNNYLVKAWGKNACKLWERSWNNYKEPWEALFDKDTVLESNELTEDKKRDARLAAAKSITNSYNWLIKNGFRKESALRSLAIENLIDKDLLDKDPELKEKKIAKLISRYEKYIDPNYDGEPICDEEEDTVLEELDTSNWVDERDLNFYLKLRKGIEKLSKEEALITLGKVFTSFDDIDLKSIYQILCASRKVSQYEQDWIHNLLIAYESDNEACPINMSPIENSTFIEELEKPEVFSFRFQDNPNFTDGDILDFESYFVPGYWNIFNSTGYEREYLLPEVSGIKIERRLFNDKKQAFEFAKDKIEEIADVYGYNFVKIIDPEGEREINITDGSYFENEAVKIYFDDDAILENIEK